MKGKVILIIIGIFLLMGIVRCSSSDTNHNDALENQERVDRYVEDGGKDYHDAAEKIMNGD